MNTGRRTLLRAAALGSLGLALRPLPATGQSPASTGDAALLSQLLQLEHSAVYGYGRLGPLLAEPLRDLARRLADVHRLQRDALHRGLLARQTNPAPPELAYVLPGPVRDPTTARAAAEAIERGTLAGYHAAIPELEEPAARALCAQLLAHAAVNLAELGARRTPPVLPPAFPGRPTP